MANIARCVKTPKGIEEVSQRSHGLSQRVRRVLIMVDGQRDGDALAGMFPGEDVAAILETLLAEEFITPLTVAAPEKKTPPPVDDAKRFEMAKNFMINTTGAFLGVMGSSLIDKLERCASLEELREHYVAWRDAIRLSPDGRKEGGELEARLSALLS